MQTPITLAQCTTAWQWANEPSANEKKWVYTTENNSSKDNLLKRFPFNAYLPPISHHHYHHQTFFGTSRGTDSITIQPLLEFHALSRDGGCSCILKA